MISQHHSNSPYKDLPPTQSSFQLGHRPQLTHTHVQEFVLLSRSHLPGNPSAPRATSAVCTNRMRSRNVDCGTGIRYLSSFSRCIDLSKACTELTTLAAKPSESTTIGGHSVGYLWSAEVLNSAEEDSIIAVNQLRTSDRVNIVHVYVHEPALHSLII